MLFLSPVSPLLFYSGNGDVTILFEGQQDHLVPCASQLLLDSDLFLMAGRILGHSVLHGGPVLVGLCPAVVCVLLGDKPDATTITLDDVPDMDLRKIIASVCITVITNIVLLFYGPG